MLPVHTWVLTQTLVLTKKCTKEAKIKTIGTSYKFIGRIK